MSLSAVNLKKIILVFASFCLCVSVHARSVCPQGYSNKKLVDLFMSAAFVDENHNLKKRDAIGISFYSGYYATPNGDYRLDSRVFWSLVNSFETEYKFGNTLFPNYSRNRERGKFDGWSTIIYSEERKGKVAKRLGSYPLSNANGLLNEVFLESERDCSFYRVRLEKPVKGMLGGGHVIWRAKKDALGGSEPEKINTCMRKSWFTYLGFEGVWNMPDTHFDYMQKQRISETTKAGDESEIFVWLMTMMFSQELDLKGGQSYKQVKKKLETYLRKEC